MNDKRKEQKYVIDTPPGDNYPATIEFAFKGPIPPPHILAAYQKTLPSAPDRILTMAENQAAHAIRMQEQGVKSLHRYKHLGQIFAFLLSVMGIIGAFTLIYTGKEISGFIALFSVLGSLIGLFFYEKADDKKK